MAKKIALKDYIRNIPDFPKPGILFRDITTLLRDKKAFKTAVKAIVDKYKGKKTDVVVAVEARGFILGGAIAHMLGAGFVPVRKRGKLPWRTQSVTYDLEYGTDTLEIHVDAVGAGDKVLIVDDLLATGGTVKAVLDLIKQAEASVVGAAFFVELSECKGRQKLQGVPIFSLIKY